LTRFFSAIPTRSAFLWTFVPLVLSVAVSTFAADKSGEAAKPADSKETPAATTDWKKIAKKFQFAVAAKDPDLIARVVDEIAPLKSARACKVIIENVPFGIDHALELKVGRLLAGMTSIEARSAIYEALASDPRYQARIVLLGVAFHQYRNHDFSDALDALIARLGDKNGTVLLATVQWLGKLNAPAAASALIRLLKAEEKRPYGRLYRDIVGVLKGTTGEDLKVAADWKNYWDAQKDGVKRRKSGGKTTRVRSGADFFGVKIDSDSVVFLVDVSTSMERKDPPIVRPPAEVTQKKGSGAKGFRGKTTVRKPKKTAKPEVKKIDPKDLPVNRERLYRVKKELQSAITRLPPETSFTIVTFSHEISFLGNSAKLVRATAGNKSKAQAWITDMKSFGYTWTDTAFTEVFKRVKGFDTIVFLSDGMPRRNTNETIPKEIVLKHVRETNRFKKARVHSIGFEQSGDNLKRFLRQIATDNNGTFTSLE
jgi:hypothetical protein